MKPKTPPVYHLGSGEFGLGMFAGARFQSVKAQHIQLPTEQEFITEVLSLANFDGVKSKSPQITQLYLWFFMGAEGKRPRMIPRPAEFPSDEQLLERGYGVDSMRIELSAARDEILPVLEKMLGNIKTARLKHAAKITEWLSRLVFHGVPRFERNTLVYEYGFPAAIKGSGEGGRRFILQDMILPRAAWALALLLDKNRKFGKQLRRCKLPSCNNFFLATPRSSGGRPPHYCSEEHADKARQSQGANRSQRYRDSVRHK
jgi:hypothetical protein